MCQLGQLADRHRSVAIGNREIDDRLFESVPLVRCNVQSRLTGSRSQWAISTIRRQKTVKTGVYRQTSSSSVSPPLQWEKAIVIRHQTFGGG